MSEQTPRSRVWAIVAAVIVATIAIDQWSKTRVQETHLLNSQPNAVSQYQARTDEALRFGDETARSEDNFLIINITYLRNLGVAWGNLTELPQSMRVPVLTGIGIMAVLVLSVLLRNIKQKTSLTYISAALVVAGAVGNMIDRVRWEYVIDFVQVRWRIFGAAYSFPVFNVADIAICVGWGLIVIASWRGRLANRPSSGRVVTFERQSRKQPEPDAPQERRSS